MVFSLAHISTMQVNEDLVKGTGKPLTDVLSPESINSNSVGFCMVLPSCINPIAAGPSLQVRGQPGLPARPIFGFSDKAAGESVFIAILVFVMWTPVNSYC